jgi:hypothetical protein
MTISEDKWRGILRVRLGHVRRVLQSRYGVKVPDDDAGYEDLRVYLHTKAQCCLPRNRERALLNEIDLMAPWMPVDRARQVAAEIATKPMKLTSITLGQMLNLSSEERVCLSVWQIRAVGETTEDMKERRRQRNRDLQRIKRARDGSQTREQYRRSALSNTKPWEAMGVCRRTYERRRAKAADGGVASPSADKVVPVSQVRGQSTLLAKDTHLRQDTDNQKRGKETAEREPTLTRRTATQMRTRTCDTRRTEG